LKCINLSGKYDTAVISLELRGSIFMYITRGNNLRLEKNRSKYDLRKNFFISKVVNMWNSRPNDVVLCDTVNKIES